MIEIPLPTPTPTGRERIMPTLIAIRDALLEIASELRTQREKLDELAARPPREVIIREWRPDHRRHVDGGRPVREQRKDRTRDR